MLFFLSFVVVWSLIVTMMIGWYWYYFYHGNAIILQLGPLEIYCGRLCNWLWKQRLFEYRINRQLCKWHQWFNTRFLPLKRCASHYQSLLVTIQGYPFNNAKYEDIDHINTTRSDSQCSSANIEMDSEHCWCSPSECICSNRTAVLINI